MGSSAALAWFGDTFTPRLAAAFTQPVYLAYFAMIAHEQATTNPSLNANIEQGTILQTHYHYF